MIEFTITDAAGDKLLDVLDLNQQPPQMLRVSIKGGGCAGFEYQFEIDTQQEEGDYRFEHGAAVVLVDPISGNYLNGAHLDYIAEKFDARFVLKNPNAQTTCGCGQSFAA